MFTGLIQDLGRIEAVRRRGGGTSLAISTALDLRSFKVGDSMAVDGVCLTMVELSEHVFTAEVSPETLRRSTLGEAREGRRVNLEAPLRLSDPLGGHLVAGHVDGIGEILRVSREGESFRYRFRVPAEVGRYLIEKGSVAVDGISLTVAERETEEFEAAVLPHTAAVTTLGRKGAGERVNLEADMIAKYVERFLGQQGERRRESRISPEFLARHGFLEGTE
ncbi:MAG: riboflavin synthase [Deltaproteobacteria bacterium]|nr:riboflavin synthase [Deltaproteobacteria bacterium]